ncbi:MAG: hypothetical protein FWD87_07920 [Spirochaetaceae bacterium]|nr:hypothetical protein [Spirochaetaceae bacterium]
MKLKLYLLLLFFIPAFLSANQLYFATWGFSLYLPIGYEFVEGNALDRFSFRGPSETMFDMTVHNGTYQNIKEMMQDISHRLGNTGDTSFFEYGGKAAAIMELRFGNMTGWGLGIELENTYGRANPPLLLALAYAPVGKEYLNLFHISALNSIAPTLMDTRRPGPIMEFAYPRGELREVPLAGGLGLTTMIREHDAFNAQALIEQEFRLLTLYLASPYLQDAWIRYYRAIYRDSWDRIANAALQIAQSLNMPSSTTRGTETDANVLAFVQRALTFVQAFQFERNLEGSDFINLVTAITEGRGGSDSRAMLWAIIVAQANIPAAIMVSRHYSHAMGLAAIPGPGARLEAEGVGWLVAETTANVDIGLIVADKSDPAHWLGVIFE